MTLGVSPITGTVYSGAVNGDMWVGKKTDVTSDFLRCVLEKAKHHGGEFEIRGGGQVFTVTVTQTGEKTMNDKNTGEPAFPYTEANGANSGDVGMTLRDYFAAKAMQAEYHLLERRDQFASCAMAAYLMADAMLEARSAK